MLSLNASSLYTFCLYTFCLFIRLVIICFVSLYLISLYVWSFIRFVSLFVLSLYVLSLNPFQNRLFGVLVGRRIFFNVIIIWTTWVTVVAQWVTVVAQWAKAPGIHCYVAGSIPAVTPRYCTKKIEKCSLEHKKTKGKKYGLHFLFTTRIRIKDRTFFLRNHHRRRVKGGDEEDIME